MKFFPHERASKVAEILNNLHVFNSYGLFRRMTGVDGRPELVVMGTLDN